MFKQLIVTGMVLMFLAVPASVLAQSVDMQATLARMTAIIAEMEKLRAEFAALATSAGQSTAPTPSVLGVQTSGPVFTEPLVFGETNNDIKRIQKLLATDPEIYPYGVASGMFGPKTEEAIKNLQARQGWDTPGVVGPATRDLLEAYFKAYPDENWPADVLKSKPPAPKVLGVSTSVSPTITPPTPSPTPTPTVTSSGGNLAKEINVSFDDGEALIEIIYINGNRKGLVTDTDDEDEIIEFIAGRTVLTKAMIEAVIDFDGKSSKKSSKGSGDKDEAEEALDDAEDAIDDADEAIDEADEDGDDVDWAEDTLDDADEKFEAAEEAYDEGDYDEAIDLAKEAKSLAKKAEDRIDEKKGSGSGDPEDIDKIEVEVEEDESTVTVYYEDDEDHFTVEEDREDKIIEAVADELDMDEDDVEDLIEFEYGKVARIEVTIDEDEDTALARVFYKSGVERRVRLKTTDEDEILEEVADEIGVRESSIEDVIEFN